MTRNIVLIVLDTVRKDYFDKYAPRIKEASDLSFNQCRSASSWSVPSHASIFTGKLPHQHGIHADSFDRTITYSSLDVSDTFLDDLDSHSTIGVSANPYANSFNGFDELFDNFNDVITHGSFFPEAFSPYEFFRDRNVDRSVRTYLSYLWHASRRDRAFKSVLNGFWPFFNNSPVSLPLPGITDDGASAIAKTVLRRFRDVSQPHFTFVNFMDAHAPFRNLRHYDDSLHSVSDSWNSNALNKWEINKDGKGSEQYLANYRELYGASIDYLDRKVEVLIDDIQEGTEYETTFVITADHGHNLGYPADEGFIHHSGSLSEGVLHVPLEIINPPEGASEAVTDIFTHLDIGDLLVDMANDRRLNTDLFRDYVPAEVIGLDGTGDPRNHRSFEEGEYEYWNRMIRVLYDDMTKYEWDSLGTRRVFSLDSDRPCWQEQLGEPVDFSDEMLDIFDQPLVEYKEQYEGGTSDEASTIPEERLEDLGYL
ncbi:sulfatase [Haloarcula hispanica]|uniref:Sulfatase n=1 Tax=Haloarcula hispanica TaxID=51589 RepID=A0A5J5LLE9_HALHI|nr:sulfatase-like hydrolase/transferase [Haloarcula hispanica]KAA9410367.1 sulfatase [Haloarcula hispanica]